MRWLFIITAISCLAWSGFPRVGNDTFQEGEYALYRMHYGLLTGGYASVRVNDTLHEIQNKICFHLEARGWTTSSFDVFYKVRDNYESYVDKNSLLPLHFKRDIQEGGFKSFTEIHFDHERDTAHYTHRNKNITPYPVPANIHDVVSSFFFARATNNHQSLKPGDRIPLTCFLDRETFKLEAKMLAREKIKVSGKWYNALHFKLLVEEAGLLTDGGKVDFWISDDKNKLLLRMESELWVGSIKADLIESRGLKHPMESLIPN
jgi:hypothetical protein